MSNFQFLRAEWPELHESAQRAETLANTGPRACCFYARRTLELAVEWLYQHDAGLKRPYDDNLSALIYEPTFKQNLSPGIFLKVRAVKEIGNLAVHSRKPVNHQDAVRATKELFHFLYWLARSYTLNAPGDFDGVKFDEQALPPRQVSVPVQTVEQLRRLEEEFHQQAAELAEKNKKLEDTDAEIARLRQEIAEAKKQNQTIPDNHDYSEAETRTYIIDLMLREAGWPLDKTEDREFEVTGMPNNQGVGYVDYVLWGDDGKPLAVVEAKRTTKDARIGRQQAKLYADCLQARFEQRPLIFYTNGYKTWFWDDCEYPPREVQGFYKKDELQLLIQRRAKRKDLAGAKIKREIVNRAYQEEAIRSITDDLTKKERKALVVMATGAGKTRTVIALCELLQRCNWVKRVLFLADRVALVKQACNAFKKHLPDSNPVNLVTERDAADSRVYVCTYPTMMRLIDEKEDGAKRFGVGHFDLVVIDEAHRSVYQKYRAIFDYFDSLLVGLTATPRAEIDRNTYSLFDVEDRVPTFAYELQQAVADGYLVPARPMSVPIRFPREGIQYDDLSEEEKEKWDEIEWDEDGNVPNQIDAPAVNSWLFNDNTVDKVLETLMRHGQKIAGGDVLGKTIIFAKNHEHAMFIEERFNKNYPHLKGKFAQVIDNYITYSEKSIDEFSTAEYNPEKEHPQIAVSVDMLDTGIDIPEVVNLVFFKVVRSKTKFFQMIGRGTRLRPDLFGPGEDKEFFYIFDFCGNLEFFGQNAQGVEGSIQVPLNERRFVQRLELLEGIRKLDSQDEDVRALDNELATTLQTEVAAMNTDNFIVRPHLEQVEKYRESQAWESLQSSDYEELAHIVAGLPSELPGEDETAKRFDVLVLKTQLAVLHMDRTFVRLSEQIREIARRLEDKSSVPMVKEQLELIQDLQQDEYWADITLPMLEQIRTCLRDLVKFIDKKERKPIFTNFEDELGEMREVSLSGLISASELERYRRKVMSFLQGNERHIAIHKLKHNVAITPSDIGELERIFFESGEVVTKEAFEQVYGKQKSLGLFIRKLIGLDREAAKKAFNEYLDSQIFNANQIRFINLIIDYLTQNGVMDAGKLYEPPFTNFSASGVDGVFRDQETDKIISILEKIRENAAA